MEASLSLVVSTVESVFAGFGLKLVLNGVSTGANITKGRVYGNTMINLTLSNDKVSEWLSSNLVEYWNLYAAAVL